LSRDGGKQAKRKSIHCRQILNKCGEFTSKKLAMSVSKIFLKAIALATAVFCCGKVPAVSTTNEERFLPAVQQNLSPSGIQVELLGSRPQALALSPDGKILATSGKSSELIIVDPKSGEILQELDLPPETNSSENPGAVSSHILDPDEDGQLSFTGLIFSPDGKRIFLSNVNGSIKVFGVGADHRVKGLYTLPLPEVGLSGRKEDIPADLAISPDGKILYVALNLSNRLLEYDLEKQKPLRTFDTGVAPFDVVLTGKKVYVSNWGGRRPDASSVTGPSGHGTRVRVDPVRYIANEGSVSVIDLKSGKVTEIPAGLHSCAMALTPNGRYLCVANAAGDSVSVIDTRKDKVVETISLRWHPGDLFGASPNALTVSRDGKTLYVCNGTQNAVAVISLRPGKSKLEGLIPVGWFPGAVVEDARRHKLYVANIKGAVPKLRRPKYNSHQYFGTLSLLPIPGKAGLTRLTDTVLRNYRSELAEAAMQPARANRPARPVPERAAEPSLFKHVVYIVKENRTYDQVLGDIREGNGDRNLCVFGEKYTPNQHKLAREFVLLDNTYCSGILSADGHQWAMSAFATDYMERSFAGFPRSYPDGMEPNDVDALAYSPAGFIWDSVIAAGKTFRDYGEFTIGAGAWKNPAGKKAPTFADFYEDFTNGTGLMKFSCAAGVASLAPYIKTDSVGWDLAVPDVIRASLFIKELHEFETAEKMPEFIIICLPNDHTEGTKAGKPIPGVYVADNDLAFGQIIEAISHSKFWKDTCVFAIEDDPQSGWDHISAYRTTAYVVSPYTKRHAVVSTGYNQPGMLRTIELILGLKPLNQMDAAATPMFDCFVNEPDFTPFNAVPSDVRVGAVNPSPSAIKDPVLRQDAVASARMRFDKPDQCPEALLNRILWHAQKGNIPYPDWAITGTGDDD
jgi:YVTN family beta-propeller protein